jgi:putative pyoverdin transport system ATP-binding/permease protein
MKVIQLLQKESGYFAYIFILLGVISGGLSASIMPFVSSVINELTTADSVSSFNYQKASLFLLIITVLMISQRLFSKFLIKTTQKMIHRLRLNVLEKVRKANYYAFEQIGKEKIYASITTDAATVSNSAANIVYATTAIVNVFFCLVYLAYISLAGLAITLLAMFLGIAFYWLRQKSIITLFVSAREKETLFFKYIDELLSGFKEVKVDRKKNNALFEHHIKEVSSETRELTAKGILKYLDNSLVGQTSFMLLIAVILFVFPVIGFEKSAIISYVFVILYIIGPIEGIMVVIPTITQANISLIHIEEISKKAESIIENLPEEMVSTIDFQNLHLNNITFNYNSNNGDVFGIGPVSLEVNKSDLVFIVGGNGSGKTTLFKLLTGLYEPHSGKILVNNEPIDLHAYRDLFSPIYSDFHLFEKPYGYTIDTEKEKFINQLIKEMGLEEKVAFENGKFTSTSLSTGQRKRLALIACIIEDKPIIVLDEWAADQDPQFRKHFYQDILPQLTAKGKTVIAITHDDHYFDMADKIYKMEYGKLNELKHV